MSDIELSIWAAMLGALLMFFGAALADTLRNPSVASGRALCFIVLMGASAMMLSGWVEHVADIEESTWLMPAKVALGPLSGALGLFYLGIWFRNFAQDPWLDRLIHWSSLVQCMTAAALLACAVIWPEYGRTLLVAAFVHNFSSAILALVATARGVVLGDRLAMVMLIACVFLSLMVMGLYAKSLGWASSVWLWAFTAFCTGVYFLITTLLTFLRNRQMRLVVRMSEGVAKNDEITGLPVGGHLLSKVDDALWRTVRAESEGVVMAIWIDNLYAFNDAINNAVEQEIRHVLTARIRRAIGFRHTLGLHQPRCFVAAVSAITSRQHIQTKITKMIVNLQRPIQVGMMLGKSQQYTPKIAIGVVYVGLGHITDPLSAMDHAQTLARKALREPSLLVFEEAHPASSGLSTKSSSYLSI